MVHVLIADGNPLERKYLEILIKKEKEKYRLVRSIDCFHNVEEICQKNQVNLILLDVDMMCHSNNFQIAGQLKEKIPYIKIVLLTSLPECTYFERAKEAQIDSFWYKTSEEITLLDVMNRTMSGESVYPQSVLSVPIGNTTTTEFSKRELDVLREVVCGALDSEISEKLHISLRTVKSHIQHLRTKTGFRNRTELAVWARGCGLIINEK